MNLKRITYHILYIFDLIILSAIILSAVCGCGSSVASSGSELSKDSRGYVLYVFAKRTEVMIDFCKKDGLTRGTKLDVVRPKVQGMYEPVKLGELIVEKVGDKMSKAKVGLITSSLKMEKGDRVYPHPIIIVSDESWIAQTAPENGWKSEITLPNQRNWTNCQIIQDIQDRPAAKQLIADTNAKPVWHPAVTAKVGNIYFRKVFQIDAKIASATLDVICGGNVNIFLNDNWIGEVKEPEREERKEWPQTESFKVGSFLRKGRNIVAVQVSRDPRIAVPPVLLMAINVQTSFR